MAELSNIERTRLAANWPVGTIRYFAVDYDAGSDANQGWSDTSMADAGTKALKTLERLYEVMPWVGAGRKAVVAIKPRAAGATYRNKANTADDDLLVFWSGYRHLDVRGTSDFSDSTADKIRLGGITALAGPNGDGSWTCAAGTDSLNVVLAAGTVSTAVDDTGPRGFRVRFKGNVTPGIADRGEMFFVTTSTTAFKLAERVQTPVTNDEFFIERPGVAVGRVLIGSGAGAANESTTAGMINILGIRATGSPAFRCASSVGQVRLGFCEAVGTGTVRFDFANLVSLTQFWTSADGINTSAIGLGLRSAGAVTVFATTGLQIRECAFLNSTRTNILLVLSTAGSGLGRSTYARTGFKIDNCGGHGVSDISGEVFSFFVGDSVFAGVRQPLTVVEGNTVAGISIEASNVLLSGPDITGVGALPAIRVSGISNVMIDLATGSTGNTDVGLDLTAARGAKIVMANGGANTVTGTAGDIRLAGPAITTHAGLGTTNVVDNQGNEVLGGAGKVVGVCTLVSNQSGGALAIGDQVKSNGTTDQVTSAKADVSAASAALLGTMVTPPASAANGYMVCGPQVVADHDGVPTVGAITYLSPGTAAKLTTTVPALAGTNQKLRVGRVIATVSGNLARVSYLPEALAVAADGNP